MLQTEGGQQEFWLAKERTREEEIASRRLEQLRVVVVQAAADQGLRIVKPTKRIGAKPAILVGDFRFAKFGDDGSIVLNTEQCPNDLPVQFDVPGNLC